MDHVTATFKNSPDGIREIMLSRRTYITEAGFGVRASIYPVTVTTARYGGSYEGGPWVAFPVSPWVLGEHYWRDWCGSDIECSAWWDRAVTEDWPVGRGTTPDLSYLDLIETVAARAGITLSDWSEEPTWDKDELRRRGGQDPAV